LSIALTVSVIRDVTIILIRKTEKITLPKDEIVNFEALELEEGKEGQPGTQQKLAEHVAFLKENLSPEKYAEAMKSLGLDTDLSNEDLLAEIKNLIGKKKEDDGEDDGEEENMMSYKDFMSKCMGEGKSLKECADEFKEKYPEAKPTDKEMSEIETLAKKKEDDYPTPDEKKMKALEDQVAKLTKTVTELSDNLAKEKNTAQLSAEVEKLVAEKHIAPSQKEGLIKLAASLGVEDQKEMLQFFRTTQKMGGLFQDAGAMPSNAPGGHKPSEITPERREELLQKFSINDIINDRGVRPRRNN